MKSECPSLGDMTVTNLACIKSGSTFGKKPGTGRDEITLPDSTGAGRNDGARARPRKTRVSA